jgi:DNA-binding NarL/FixJ family response regulator
MVHGDRVLVDATLLSGLMSTVPERRAHALLHLLHTSTGITRARLTAVDAQGRQVTVAALARGARGPVRTADTVIRRLTDASGRRIGALYVGSGQHHTPAVAAAIGELTPCFAAVADVASRRLRLGLTSRETEVLAAVAEGRTNADIARRDNVSVRTVTTHVEAIFRKLGVSNRVQAARVALHCGLADAHSAGMTSAQGLAAS